MLIEFLLTVKLYNLQRWTTTQHRHYMAIFKKSDQNSKFSKDKRDEVSSAMNFDRNLW